LNKFEQATKARPTKGRLCPSFKAMSSLFGGDGGQVASAEEVAAAIAGTGPRGFRFAVTKTPGEQVPYGLDKHIFDVAARGNLDELLGLCQEWAGHPVIDAYRDEFGNALIVAANKGHAACVRLLIAAKADVAYADRNGETALHHAAFYGRASACRVLVDEGAPLTGLNSYGQTPLQVAIQRRKSECVAILEEPTAVAILEAPTAVEYIDHQAREARIAALTTGFRFAVTKAPDEQAPAGMDKQIFEAAKKGCCVELLGICEVWSGHSVIEAYDVDKCARNALLIAAVRRRKECVRVLIAARADVNWTNRYGWTALHCAALKGCAPICRLLIDEGALLTAVTNDGGHTPLELAKEQGKGECVAILQAAGAVLPPAAAAAHVVVEHIATTRGYRFADTEVADEQAPPDGVDKQIYDAAGQGKLIELLDLCQQWAGHPVIDAYRDVVY